MGRGAVLNHSGFNDHGDGADQTSEDGNERSPHESARVSGDATVVGQDAGGHGARRHAGASARV